MATAPKDEPLVPLSLAAHVLDCAVHALRIHAARDRLATVRVGPRDYTWPAALVAFVTEYPEYARALGPDMRSAQEDTTNAASAHPGADLYAVFATVTLSAARIPHDL
jgi:hypothetical protein